MLNQSLHIITEFELMEIVPVQLLMLMLMSVPQQPEAGQGLPRDCQYMAKLTEVVWSVLRRFLQPMTPVFKIYNDV